MKKFTLFILFTLNLILSFGQTQELNLDAFIAQSDVLAEATIVDKESFFDSSKGFIRTKYSLQVHKTFKGNSEIAVQLIEDGGIYGNEMLIVSHSFIAEIGDQGIVAMANNNGSYLASFGDNSFLKYTPSNVSNSHFSFQSIQEVYNAIETITTNNFQFKSELIQSNPSYYSIQTAGPEIESISPLVITAGTSSILEIHGNGFGSAQGGSNYVEFSNSDDAGATNIQPHVSDYVLWSDTLIKVKVPTKAASGFPKVFNGIDQATSNSSLTVRYAITNIMNSTSYEPFHRSVYQGGYELKISTGFYSTYSVEACIRAMNTWRCETGMNWQLLDKISLSAPADDGENVISRGSLPTGVLGTAYSYYSSCNGGTEWVLKGFDIVISNSATFNYGPGQSSEFDLESVLLHEFGHAHGLNHVIDVNDVMHYNIPTAVTRRTLNTDNIEAGLHVMANSIPSGCGDSPIVAVESESCIIPGWYNIGISEILGINGSTCQGVTEIRAVITNFGLDKINSAQIEWKFNGNLQTTYDYYFNWLNPGESDTVTLGNITLNTGNNALQAWTKLPQGYPEVYNDNDTMSINFNINSCYTLDASVSRILDVQDSICPGSKDVSIEIVNYGNDELTSLEIVCEINDIIIDTFYWSGSLFTGEVEDVIIGNYSLSIGGNNVRVWVQNPNGLPDLANFNDTIDRIFTPTKLNGTYSVGGVNPDFINLEAVRSSLVMNGICGPVIFEFRPGSYGDVEFSDSINGASEINTITFTSENLDSANVMFSSFEFENVSHIRIHHVTFIPNYVSINLNLICSDYQIFNCYFQQSSLSHIYAYTSEVDFIDNVRIENCIFESANSNIRLNGSYNSDISILNNSFNNPYKAIFVSAENLELGYNTINSCSNVGFDISGSFEANVHHNILRDVTSSGIDFESISSRGIKIYNNFFQNAFVSLRGNNHQLINNTFINQNTTSTKAIVMTYCDTLFSYNNIFQLYNSERVYNDGGPVFADNNHYFVEGGKLAYFSGGPSSQSFEAWQQYFGIDLHSTYGALEFETINSFKVNPTGFGFYINDAAIPYSFVTTDIENEARSISNPDVGADEFSLRNFDVETLSDTEVSFCSSGSEIRSSFVNFGNQSVSELDLSWSIDNGPVNNYHWSGFVQPGDTASFFPIDVVSLSPGIHSLKLWSHSPNGQQDGWNGNDTLIRTIHVQGLSGNYTVGGTNPDFQTFQALSDTLNNQGVCGPVIFNIRPGVYWDRITLNHVFGSSEFNTILFQPENGDSTSVKLSEIQNIVELHMTPYVTFDAINFQSNGTRIVLDSSSNCVFNHCTFDNVKIDLVEESFNVKILNNYFESTTTSILSDASSKKITIANNHFNCSANNIIEVSGMETTIIQNRIESSSLSLSPYNEGAVTITNGIIGLTLSGNSIVTNYNNALAVSGTWFGLEPGLIMNNEIISRNAREAVVITESYKLKFIHNSILAENGYGMRLNNPADSVIIANNIITSYNHIPLEYISFDESNFLLLDFNDIFSTSDTLIAAFINNPGNYTYFTSMFNIYSNLGICENCYNIDPGFLSNMDLHLQSSSSVSGMGNPQYGVASDFDNELRSTNSPDPGMDEFIQELAPHDVGVFAISFNSDACSGFQNISVQLVNYGLDTLTSATIYLNTYFDSTYSINWTGQLASLDSQWVMFNNVWISAPDTLNLQSWANSPNGNMDIVALNDTSQTGIFNLALNGNYTVGFGGDFSTINGVTDYLNEFGVCGPVVFDFMAGSHFGSMELHPILGSSNVNSITFQSLNGESETTILELEGQNGIELIGTQNVTFQNLTLKCTDWSNATALFMSNGADNISVKHCIVQTINESANSGSSKAIVLNQTQRINLLIDNCTFPAATNSGIYLHNPNNAIDPLDSIVVTNCLFSNAITGIEVRSRGYFELVHNEFESNNSNSEDIGIQILVYNCSAPFEIIGNRVFGNMQRALQVEYCNSTSGRSLVANNSFNVADIEEASSGILSFYSSQMDYFYNTIKSTPKGTYVGAVSFTNCYDIKMINNNIQSLGAQSPALKLLQSTLHAASDNNNYSAETDSIIISFSTSPVSNNFFTTIAEFTNFSGTDTNSTSFNPFFTSDTSLTINNFLLQNTGLSGLPVLDDFYGTIRNISSPDVGAFESDLEMLDAVLSNIKVNSECADISNVTLDLFNAGEDSIFNVTINWSVNGIIQPAVLIEDTVILGESIENFSLGMYDFTAMPSALIDAWISEVNSGVNQYTENDTIYSTIVFPKLQGTYTIGGTNSDYVTLNEAVYDLNTYGICGPTLFLIRDGSYVETIELDSIDGSSQTNTITFRSESLDSSAVIIKKSILGPIITLNGTSNIAFEHLHIVNESSFNQSNEILIKSESKHIKITNCWLESGVDNSFSSTHNGWSNIRLWDCENNEDILVENNLLINGAFGVFVNPYNSVGVSDLVIKNNVFRNHHSSAISIQKTINPIIQHNLITTSQSSASSTGIFLSGIQGAVQLSYNAVYWKNGKGVSITNSSSPILSTLSNNMISLDFNSNNSVLYLNNCDSLNIFYNSLFYNSTNSSSSVLNIGSSQGIQLKNNIIYHQGIGKALVTTTTTALEYSNYNDFYSSATNLMSWGGTSMNYSTFKTTTGFETNGLNLNPLYNSGSDLHLQMNSPMNSSASTISGISDDIDGEVRGFFSDIGADEFVKISYNAAAIDIFTDNNCNVNKPIYFVVKNLGALSINALQIAWSVNSISQPTYNYSGSLALNETDTVLIGNINQLFGESDTIQVITSQPNGILDQVQSNDTVQSVIESGSLSGLYTIGGVNPDYLTLNDAFADLNQFGVCDNVYLAIRSGEYVVSDTLFNVVNVASDKQIFIYSEALSADSVTLKQPSTGVLNGILNFQNVSYITVEHLTFEISQSTNGRILTFDGDFEDIKILNNTFRGLPNSPTTNLFDQITGNYTSSLQLKNITIGGNQFYHGARGIVIGGRTTYYGQNALIENNYFNGQSSTASGIFYMRNAIVRNNEILNSGQGVSVSRIDSLAKIYNNKVYNSLGVGFVLSNLSGKDSCLIFNNMVKIIGTSQSFGMSITTVLNGVIAHNTILNENSHNLSAAVRILSSGNTNFYNNILSATNGGYTYYVTNSSQIGTCNFNSLYSSVSRLAYWGADKFTMAALTSASGEDANSLRIDPQFISLNDLHINQLALNGAGLFIPYLNSDIDGEPRLNTPDIGADEIQAYANDATIVRINAGTCSGGDSIMVDVKNVGSEIIDSLEVFWQINGGPINSVWYNQSIAVYDVAFVYLQNFNFVPNQNYDFKAWCVTASNLDENQLNDTLNLTNLTVSTMYGSYTVGTASSDFMTITAAIDALEFYGICDDVILNIASGSYNEQLTIHTIPGTELGYRVTIQSEATDYNSVSLNYDASSNLDDWIILLDGAKNITIQHIKIVARNQTYSTGVKMINEVDEIEIKNNFIFSTSIYKNGVEYNSWTGKRVLIEDNIINGFAVGILVVNSVPLYLTPIDSAQTLIVKNEIFNNQFANISLQYAKKVSVKGNYVHAFDNVRPYTGGIHVHHSKHVKIYENIMEFEQSKSMVMNASDSAIVWNNVFKNTELIAATLGIELQSSTGVEFYYNTVTLNSINPQSACLKAINADAFRAKNNLFVNSWYGKVINADINSTGWQTNNNLYFTKGSTYLTFGGVNYSDLPSYFAATGNEQNSFNYDPLFVANNWHLSGNSPIRDSAELIAWISTDIDGEMRDLTPSIGADELKLPTIDLGPDTSVCESTVLSVNVPIGSVLWSNGSTENSINVTESGEYWVYVESPAGTVSDTVNITIDTISDVELFDSVTCDLQTIVLNSPITAQEYLWSTGETTSSITVSVTGNFWLEATNGSCISSDVAHIYINANPDISLPNELISCDELIVEAEIGQFDSLYWSTGELTNPITVNTNGLYVLTAWNKGCFDQDSIDVTINQSTLSQLDVETCDSYIWNANGIEYFSSGSYIDTLVNSAGCDSILTLNLTVNSSFIVDTFAVECDSFIWNGITYQASGDYSYNTFTSNGCDSLIVLHLTLTHNSTSTIIVEECDSYYWDLTNTEYNQSGEYSFVTQNSNGCDSTITLDLTLFSGVIAGQIDTTVCSSFTSPSGNYIWNESGTYNDTLTTLNGCDSILQINLTVPVIDNTVLFDNLGTYTAAEPNADYQWINCDNNQPIIGETSMSFTPTLNGNYAVIISSQLCSDTSDCVFSSAGIHQLGLDELLQVYPNPTSSTVYVEFDKLIEEIIVRIENSVGQIISETTMYSLQKVDVELEGEPGIYFMLLTIGNRSVKLPIVKM